MCFLKRGLFVLLSFACICFCVSNVFAGKLKPVYVSDNYKVQYNEEKDGEFNIKRPQPGVWQIFPGFYYVQPVRVKNIFDYPVRFNFYGQALFGTSIAIVPGKINVEQSAYPHNNVNPLQNTTSFGDARLGVGFELYAYYFYISFGVDFYTIFAWQGKAPDSAWHLNEAGNIVASAGQSQYVLGYKWRFMIGGIIPFVTKNGSQMMVKIAAVYSDTQLQLGSGYWAGFGYESRHPGVMITLINKGIEFGVEVTYTLMHAGSNGGSAPLVDYNAVAIDAVFRVQF